MSNGTVTIPPNAGAPEYGLDLVPDIDFAVKDPTVIQSEVILDYQAAFLALTGIAKALAPGDPVRLHLLAVCEWLSHQRTIIDFTGKMNLLKYAHDDYLDNLAALHGDRALRLQATPALCTLQFTLAAQLSFDALIPAGTQVQAPNAVTFETLEDVRLISPSLTVQVGAQCTLPGVIGNDFAPGQINSIINWNQAFGLQVANIDTTHGGADEETDDQYRYRVWLAIESYSTCGPRDAYEFWALSASPDIIQCVVHSAPEIAGEVWLYPLCRGSTRAEFLPSSEILALVEASCSAKTRRPVTDFVTAKVPTVVEYLLDMTYYVSSDNEVLLSTIQSNVQQAVADWIVWERSYISRDINTDELVRRCVEAGAKRITVATPSPGFQVLDFDEIACHSETVAPVINYGGIEDP